MGVYRELKDATRAAKPKFPTGCQENLNPFPDCWGCARRSFKTPFMPLTPSKHKISNLNTHSHKCSSHLVIHQSKSYCQHTVKGHIWFNSPSKLNKSFCPLRLRYPSTDEAGILNFFHNFKCTKLLSTFTKCN